VSTEEVVSRFLACQREMYAGGPTEALEEMLAPDVIWHVPGRSPIAGDHRGRRAVLDYFAQRRARAGGAIEITKHAQVTHGDTLVQLADGRATLAGHEQSWRTAGVYRVAGGRIAEAWLVPVDSEAFDLAWGARALPSVRPHG
jgi:ketosteroid isomerase-like protein